MPAQSSKLIPVGFLIVLCSVTRSSLHHSPSSGTGSTHMWCLLLLHVEINHLQSILTHCQPSLFPLSCQDIVTAEWAGKSISWRSQSRQHFSLITLNFLLYDMQKKPLTNPSCCLFHLLGCCLDWVSRCGRTGFGFLKATAGLTWRTAMEKYSPNYRTSGLLYPLLSAS